MVNNVEKVTLWKQTIKCKLVQFSKKVIERRVYHQPQVETFVFYRKYSAILAYFDDCLIVLYTQKITTRLIESLNNSPENYVLIHEGDTSILLGVNIKKHLDGKFE